MGKPPNQRYYGSTVIGEKGQIVIPVEARKAFHLSAGDKVMVFGQEFHGTLVIMRADVVAEYVSRGLTGLGELARVLSEETAAEERATPPPSTSPVCNDSTE